MMRQATVALIPARGGSKGLPGKNIRPLLGKPMLQYSIEAALGCSYISEVYVSTDDPEILNIAHACGALTPPLRPAELANETASSRDVACHFLTWYQQEFSTAIETLVLLQPTSPLRTSTHLTEAMSLYESHQSELATVVSVTMAKPIAWQGFIQPENGSFRFHEKASDGGNRQTEPTNYQLNGAIYIASAARYLDNTLMQQPVYPYIMSQETSVDIDTYTDFLVAEAILATQTTLLPS